MDAMTIEWQRGFETGFPEIDDDHRRLVALVNDLDRILAAESDLAGVGIVIDQLVAYADYHFQREEVMLKAVNYGDLDNHAEIHARFGQFLGGMIGDCMVTPSVPTIQSLRDYLQVWLVEHILVEDMKYVAALRGVIPGRMPSS
ncbi:conserved hypothetical protein [Candidatus Terasakiella magnetica]|nr:conserved hypothetical protein [Candidatus Terasakiella magnetica]